MTSWKTTAAGVVAAIGILITLIANPLLDSDPATLPSWWSGIAAAAGALGIGWFARDNNVTSEEAGAGEQK